MKRAMFTLALAIASPFAIAATDYKCLTDCQKAGYTYSYCQRVCAY